MDDAKVISEVKSGLSWLQKHERIVLFFMVLLVMGYLGNKWIDRSADAATIKYQIAQSQLDAMKEQSAQARADYQSTVDALTKQNASLATAVAQRQIILQQRQEEIKTLPLPEVGVRWQGLIGGSGDVVSDVHGLNITDGGARRTVSMLEEVPVLKADKSDLKKVADNLQTELGKANGIIAADELLIKKGDDTCKLEVTAAKAVARKSKRNWFIAGFVAGIATRILVKF